MDNGWPKEDPVNPIMTSQMKYLISLKSEIRLALEKAMSGGKKKGKGGKGDAPEAQKKTAWLSLAIISQRCRFRFSNSYKTSLGTAT